MSINRINLDNIRGAIFDLDGTLLDSMSIWSDVGIRFLINRGIIPDEGHTEKFNKMSLKQASEYYVEHYGANETPEEIAASINKMVEKFYFYEVTAKAGVAEFLELLKQKGIKMCVATATDKYLVEKALERNGILEYFSDILTCTIVGAGKDEPVIYDESLKLLNTEKPDTLVFEDAYYAMKTAFDAGFRVIAVTDSSEKAPIEKIEAASETVLNNYFEFGKIFC